MSALLHHQVIGGDDAPQPLSMQCVRARLAGKSILLAEDNPLSQELTRMLLEKTGARLCVVDTGVAALAAMSDGPYDCVLMDVQMPLMDGDEATRRLRAEARFAKVPVLGLTANGGSAEREHCLAAGMNDFLVRPIQPALFYQVLVRWADPAGESVVRPACRERGTEFLAAEELVSLSVLASLVDNDPETMQRLLAIFLDNAAATLHEMTAAAMAGDTMLQRALCHRLKASARAVGAMRVAAVCSNLEMHAGSSADTALLLAELRPLLYLMRIQHAATASRNANQEPT